MPIACWRIKAKATHSEYVTFHWRQSPIGPGPPNYRGFTIPLRHTKLCRNPLDKWSARRGDRYLTIHNTHKKRKIMPPLGFEPAIPASPPESSSPKKIFTKLFLKSFWLEDEGPQFLPSICAYFSMCTTFPHKRLSMPRWDALNTHRNAAKSRYMYRFIAMFTVIHRFSRCSLSRLAKSENSWIIDQHPLKIIF
jgi:hypothetical protein